MRNYTFKLQMQSMNVISIHLNLQITTNYLLPPRDTNGVIYFPLHFQALFTLHSYFPRQLICIFKQMLQNTGVWFVSGALGCSHGDINIVHPHQNSCLQMHEHHVSRCKILSSFSHRQPQFFSFSVALHSSLHLVVQCEFLLKILQCKTLK